MIQLLPNLSKLEVVQCSVSLVFTCAIRRTSRERLYRELVLESLKHQRWSHKSFFSIKQSKDFPFLFAGIFKVTCSNSICLNQVLCPVYSLPGDACDRTCTRERTRKLIWVRVKSHVQIGFTYLMSHVQNRMLFFKTKLHFISKLHFFILLIIPQFSPYYFSFFHLL